MKTSTRSALTLSLALLVASASASAAPRDSEPVTKTVRFGDLDLSTGVGAAALYDRITLAARFVCRDLAMSFKAMHECRDRAVEEAVRAVGNPLLSSVHSSTVDRIEELVRR